MATSSSYKQKQHKKPQGGQSATSKARDKPSENGNWLNRTVQGYIGSAGDYAGGLVRGVGDGVNKVGENIGGAITNTTRGWGQQVAGYGNDIKDAVGASGPRVMTAGNPLGLAGAGSGKLKSAPKRQEHRGTASNPLGL